MVGLVVDVDGQVPLLDKGPVGAGPEVEEDVQEVSCLEVNSADHLNAVLLEDCRDPLSHLLQGPTSEPLVTPSRSSL